MIIQTPKKLLIICVLLPLAFVLPQVAEARFDSHQKRYMSNKDYASVFRQLFPLSTGSNDYKVKDCLKTDTTIQSLIGYSSPAFGEPIYSTPSPLFVRWYGNCVQRLIQEEFGKIKERGYSKKHLQNYFSHSFLQGLRVEQWELQKWYSWTKTKQLQAITEIVTHLIGPWPVLRDLGWKQEESDYIEKLLESMSTESSSSAWKALQSALLKVMMREEFILY